MQLKRRARRSDPELSQPSRAFLPKSLTDAS